MKTHPSSAEVEADAERTRAGLISTLDRLRDNLQPTHLVEEVMGSARISTTAISDQVWKVARRHPVPALMIGAGLAMVFGVGRTVTSSGSSVALGARGQADDFPVPPEFAARATHPGSAVPVQASGVTAVSLRRAYGSGGRNSIGERPAEVASKAALFGRQLPSTRKAGDPMAYSRSRDTLVTGVSRMLEEQPLIIAAIGIAVGAAIGAAIPQTDAENNLMGESSHSVRNTAQGLVEDQYTQIKSAASHAVEDIKQSVADHGLTTENVSGLVHDVGEKAKAATYEASRSVDPNKA